MLLKTSTKLYKKIHIYKRNFLNHDVQNVPEIALKLHCNGLISGQNERNKVRFLEGSKQISWLKASVFSQKEHWAFFWTFSFHRCLSTVHFLPRKVTFYLWKPLHEKKFAAINFIQISDQKHPKRLSLVNLFCCQSQGISWTLCHFLIGTFRSTAHNCPQTVCRGIVTVGNRKFLGSCCVC